MSLRLSPAEHAALTSGKRVKPSKYRNRRTTIGDLTFDSAKEARYWAMLKWREHAGEIRDLRRQTLYPIWINLEPVCDYIADFEWTEAKNGEHIVADVKGYRTAIYRLKKKMVRAYYGINIQEV